VHPPTIALTDFSEGGEEDFPIPLTAKNRFPPITAAEQMIEGPIEF